MQRNKISFKGQNVYVGIDVHLKNWHVTCVTESNYKRSIEQPADASALMSFLRKNFPEANYKAAYEAGFTGFSTYFALQGLGIETSVVNAADIPATQYEKVMKTDRRDSERIANALKGGLLRGLFIRGKEDLDDLSLVRLRKSVQRELGTNRAKVKHLLYSNGVVVPEGMGDRWTKRFVEWLKNDVRLLSSTRVCLDSLIEHVEVIHKEYLRVNRQVRDLCRSPKYKPSVELLMSIPGIGQTTAITILTEVGDFKRFRNEREFASYLGLVPSSHNSGEKVLQKTITFRGNRHLSAIFIEACWKSIMRDIALSAFYAKCRKRMNSQKAIVKVARRMSNIILSIMKSGKKYDPERIKI